MTSASAPDPLENAPESQSLWRTLRNTVGIEALKARIIDVVSEFTRNLLVRDGVKIIQQWCRYGPVTPRVGSKVGVHTLDSVIQLFEVVIWEPFDLRVTVRKFKAYELYFFDNRPSMMLRVESMSAETSKYIHLFSMLNVDYDFFQVETKKPMSSSLLSHFLFNSILEESIDRRLLIWFIIWRMMEFDELPLTMPPIEDTDLCSYPFDRHPKLAMKRRAVGSIICNSIDDLLASHLDICTEKGGKYNIFRDVLVEIKIVVLDQWCLHGYLQRKISEMLQNLEAFRK